MISCITQLVAKEGVDEATFKEAVDETCAKLVMEAGSPAHLEVNNVFKKDKGDASEDSFIADAFVIERYVDLNAYEQAAISPAYESAQEALRAVSEDVITYVCLENPVIAQHGPAGCAKKITVLGRTVPTISFEDFTREWFVAHSGCMLQLPTDIFYGYNQHLVIDRKVNGASVGHDVLPYDGVLELFQSSAEEVADVFANNPHGQETVRHRKDFMSIVNPFQVTYTVMK